MVVFSAITTALLFKYIETGKSMTISQQGTSGKQTMYLKATSEKTVTMKTWNLKNHKDQCKFVIVYFQVRQNNHFDDNFSARK